MAFGRDMVLPIDFETDWNEITRREQKRIDENCRRENKKRIEHACEEGDQVLLKAPKKTFRKSETQWRGPCRAVKHHDNGTVAIQKSPCVAENVSIRRLDPFCERED